MSLKVVVLGGAGDVGSKCVENVARTKGVSLVTIADYNIATASRIAAQLNKELSESKSGCHVVAKQVNAYNHEQLVEVIQGHDVASSALGPFFVFEPKCVRASIEAGVDYVSVCDDWKPAGEVMDEFGQKAKEKGVIVLTGMGATPGVSNVGIRLCADEMDDIHNANIHCFQPLDAGGGEAVLRHMFFIMSGNVVHFRDGKKVLLPACSEVKNPEMAGFGNIKMWNMGHAEPVTVPREFPKIKNVNYYMGYGKGSEVLVYPAKLGLFKFAIFVNLFVWLILFLERMFPTKEVGLGSLRIDVDGTKDGKPISRSMHGIGTMRGSTGTALSVGTLMVARKQLRTTEGGVHGPEIYIDPKSFMREMASLGIAGYWDLEMKKPIE